MKVHCYVTCWNDARMLPFFFRHYDSWVDRFVVFDDGSTDGTLDLLARHTKVEVRPFARIDPDSFVLSSLHVFDHAWKESRGQADWVIVTNLDEHLHHPRLLEYLETCRTRGVSVIPALGYQMLSDDFPAPHEHLCRTRTRGAPWAQMSKADIFRPDAVDEIGYRPGRHSAEPRGHIVFPERDELLNLHYKYLGKAYTNARHRELRTGLGKKDDENRWGHKYLWSPAELDEDWEAFERRLVDVSAPDLRPWASHREPRWWRADATEAPDGSAPPEGDAGV